MAVRKNECFKYYYTMQSIANIQIGSILFIDIETAPNWLNLNDAPENVQHEWVEKFRFKPDAPKTSENLDTDTNHGDLEYMYEWELKKYCASLWKREASLNPEFSRIVCISVGFMFEGNFYLKSYIHQNEGDLLNTFKEDLRQFTQKNHAARLCAHYGKGFDYPFIAKRMLINRIVLPQLLDTSHLKPWEQINLDTQEIWKIGGFNSSGLAALCLAFGIPTPKDNMNGSQVAGYYHSGRIDDIAAYCEKDVYALLNVFKAMRLEEPVSINNLISLNHE